MRKRLFAAALLAAAVVLLLPAGCSRAPAEDSGRKRIVATIFPAYDWVREVLGEKAADWDVTLLLDNGTDLHSYQPTADDVIRISTCDLFVYVGGESDAWVDDALAGAPNPDRVVIHLLDVLGDAAREEETVEGMQTEAHDHDGDHEEEEPEYDEHVWLSLRNAALFCREIAGQLGALDPAGRETYAASADAYIEKLNALDAAYASVVEQSAVRTVVFGDRFPFRYLTEDYGLAYYAAFSGCSAEAEASFETVVFLARKVDELGLHAVLTIESGDGRIAQRIAETAETGAVQVLQLDSMQSVTAADAAAGTTYLGVMEANLAVLRQALQ